MPNQRPLPLFSLNWPKICQFFSSKLMSNPNSWRADVSRALSWAVDESSVEAAALQRRRWPWGGITDEEMAHMPFLVFTDGEPGGSCAEEASAQSKNRATCLPLVPLLLSLLV